MIIASTIAVVAYFLSSAAIRQPTTPDSAQVVGVVSRFHGALASGDSAAALGLLVPDAIILESGASESLEHYRAHHLPDDIEFARAVRTTHSLVRVFIHDDFAWIASTSVSEGQFADRKINSAGAELVVLRREHTKWKIYAIHWSSRTRRLVPTAK